MGYVPVKGKVDRVAEIVGYAEKAGLVAIVNTHHDESYFLDINKAYNNATQNEKVKDVKALDHVKGEAVDLKAVGLEGRDLRFENVEIAKVIVQTVEFDELVLEDVPADGIEPKSLHVSYRKGGKNRKVVLKHVSGKAVCEELSRLDMEQLMSE